MEGEALECHEGLIYFALHKLTNGRLFLGAGTGYDREEGRGATSKPARPRGVCAMR